MSRGLILGASLTQELQLICKCCRQPYYPDRVHETNWDRLLLGIEKFAVCIVCDQQVPQRTFDDYSYRSRWIRFSRRFVRKAEEEKKTGDHR